MGMNIYKAGAETHKMMVDLINAYHPELALIQDQIVVLFREKTKKTPDGREIPGTVSKVTPKLKILSDGACDYKFQIEIAVPLWNTWDDNVRKAVLNHYLYALGVKEDEESGEIKTFIKPPEVSFYKDELNTTAEFFPTDDETWLDMERMIEAKIEHASQPSVFVVSKDVEVEEVDSIIATSKKGKKAPPRAGEVLN